MASIEADRRDELLGCGMKVETPGLGLGSRARVRVTVRIRVGVRVGADGRGRLLESERLDPGL